MNHEESYFDGGLFQLIGYSLIGILITTAILIVIPTFLFFPAIFIYFP